LPIDIAAPQVSASASPTEVRLGTPFTLFVTASFGPNVTVNLADPLDVGDAFEVRRRVSNDRKRADGQTVREWQFEVFPWELGEMAVPPLVITYTIGGNAGQVATNAVPMRIVGTLGEIDDGTKLRPPLPPKAILERSWYWAYVAGVALASLMISALAWRRWRKRQRYAQRLTGGAIAWRNLDGIDKQALARLAAITESGVLTNDVIRGYAEMAAVLRDFGGRKFGFASADSTTREWLAKFRARAPVALHADYAAWFGPADLAKYAAQAYTPEQAHAACATARDLIIAACAPPAGPSSEARDADSSAGLGANQ
ncbi:MAG TPA: hypothetical protein PLF40_18330, partial [Kofleriaceae bacterium]|nr:hypothetical protein [Kofleriaceae bacterium]